MSENNNNETQSQTLFDRVRALVPSEMTVEKNNASIYGVHPLIEVVMVSQTISHDNWKAEVHGFIFSHHHKSWSNEVVYGWNIDIHQDREYKYTNMKVLEKTVKSLVERIKYGIANYEAEYQSMLRNAEFEAKAKAKLVEVIKKLNDMGYAFKQDASNYSLVMLTLKQPDCYKHITIKGNVYNQETLEMKYWMYHRGDVVIDMTENEMIEFITLVKKWGYQEVA